MYQVQIFYPISVDTPEVGNWVETTYGGEDKDEVLERVRKMTGWKQTFSKIRVVEVIETLDCD